MKKLLVLVLVLVVSSMANANLFNITDLQNIKVVGDGVTISAATVIVTTGNLVLDASAAITRPGATAQDVVYNYATWEPAALGDPVLFADMLIPGGPPVPAMGNGVIMLQGLKVVSGSGYIQLVQADAYDTGNYTPYASVLIPEPATIAVLSLGGLLLRRKK